MIGSEITISPERARELMCSPVAVPTVAESRALEHVGRCLAVRCLETGLTASQMFDREFAGRPWTVTEVPEPGGGFAVTLSFEPPRPVVVAGIRDASQPAGQDG